MSDMVSLDECVMYVWVFESLGVPDLVVLCVWSITVSLTTLFGYLCVYEFVCSDFVVVVLYVWVCYGKSEEWDECVSVFLNAS